MSCFFSYKEKFWIFQLFSVATTSHIFFIHDMMSFHWFIILQPTNCKKMTWHHLSHSCYCISQDQGSMSGQNFKEKKNMTVMFFFSLKF
jgi:hypothetical protein